MRILKLIDDYSAGITLNANDVFHYACADAVHLDMADFPKFMEVVDRFDYHGSIAFMCMIRKCDPIKERITPEYLKAKEYLKDYVPFEANDNQDEWDSYQDKLDELLAKEEKEHNEVNSVNQYGR